MAYSDTLSTASILPEAMSPFNVRVLYLLFFNCLKDLHCNAILQILLSYCLVNDLLVTIGIFVSIIKDNSFTVSKKNTRTDLLTKPHSRRGIFSKKNENSPYSKNAKNEKLYWGNKMLYFLKFENSPYSKKAKNHKSYRETKCCTS